MRTCTKSTNWLLEDSNLKPLAEKEAVVIAEYYVVVPTKTITPESSKQDIMWLQNKLSDKLKTFMELLLLQINGVYGASTRIYVLLYWYLIGWNKDGKDDEWRAGKKDD